jgi:hypothetical protein
MDNLSKKLEEKTKNIVKDEHFLEKRTIELKNY